MSLGWRNTAKILDHRYTAEDHPGGLDLTVTTSDTFTLHDLCIVYTQPNRLDLALNYEWMNVNPLFWLSSLGYITSQLDEELGVYWINTWSKGALVKQKDEPIVARGSLNVDSYFGHSFLVVEEEVGHLVHSRTESPRRECALYKKGGWRCM